MRDAKRLVRIHRARGLQLKLAEKDEAHARDQAASQARLHDRIATLAAQVAPVAGGRAGASLAAEAHYRERLHQSATAAERRLAGAEQVARQAADRTHAARRDEKATAKLLTRAELEAQAAQRRALEQASSGVRIRHDHC